ncbi:Salivary glue protein Sgs-3 [Armadillidium nasatum]|uniref:Salivary glue protein Sgs-3 n=1 Tax=Armadillidium nasatum TaxID=96803 RepID=A0A5N5TIU0_9CRUS|nr:Salivary glue protein Sgs-3 [Armadillidium nasatum]
MGIKILLDSTKKLNDTNHSCLIFCCGQVENSSQKNKHNQRVGIEFRMKIRGRKVRKKMKSICIAVVIIFANVFGESFLHTCPSGELLCGDRSKCVPTSALCNYVQDCDDLSDEINLKLCKKIREHQSKCDPGMVACDDFTVHRSDTNINGNNNNNNDDYDHYTYSWRRHITTTTTTTTTEAPKLSRYPFLSNQCLDVITACVIGKDCLGNDHISLCQTTWYEAKEICKSIGSELAVVKGFYSLRRIRNFIKTGRTHQFNEGSDGKCVAILSKNFYLFSDQDCNLRFSPLCVKEASTKKESAREASTKEASVMEASTKEAIVMEASTKEASTKEASVMEASTKEAIVMEASTKEAIVMEASTKEAIVRKIRITEANVEPLEVEDATFVYPEPLDYLEVLDAPLQHQLPGGYVYF